MDAPPRTPLLERLCLHRPELRAWAMYDWANSGMVTVIITAVFPIYFGQVACAGPSPASTRRHAAITTVSLLVAACSRRCWASWRTTRLKKKLLALFLGLGVDHAGHVDRAAGRLGLAACCSAAPTSASSGASCSTTRCCRTWRREGELDRLSTAGYALGYVGGGLLLLFDLLMIQHPAWFGLPSGEGLTPAQETLPSRLAFLSVAVWWVVFSIPLLRRVGEPPALARARTPGLGPLRQAARDLAATLRDLAGFRQMLLMLVAFLIYNDGVGTIIRMAALYGAELGLDSGAMISAILLVQFVGIPCAFLFGALASRISAKRAILLGIGVYFVITLVAWRMRSEAEFYLLAALVGTVQGGVQALSRSLYASLIPRQRSGEFFGLFSILEKFAGVAGPGFFWLASALTGSSRAGLLSVLVFFAVGALLLSRVDVEEGRRAARAAEAGH